MVEQTTLWDISSPKFNIINDASALREDEIPEKIDFREEQSNILKNYIFGPPIWGRPGYHLFCQGTTGTGKTLLIKKWAEIMQTKLVVLNLEPTTKYIYLNCSRVSGPTQAAYEVLKQVNPFPRISNDVNYYMTDFFKEIDEKYKFVIVVLDEVDKILPTNASKSDALFYALVRAREMGELKNCYISLLCVANDTFATQKLSDGTRSSFGVNVAFFPRYNINEIYQILLHRAERALFPRAIILDVIKEIAVYSANTGGDCRKALALLRITSDLAEEAKKTQLSSEYFHLAKNFYEKEMYKKEIEDLSMHEQLALYSLIELQMNNQRVGKPHPTFAQTYKCYLAFCEKYKKEPVTDRQVREYFKGMIRTNFVIESMEKGSMYYTVIIDPVMCTKLLLDYIQKIEREGEAFTKIMGVTNVKTE